MSTDHTTIVVERFLKELAGAQTLEPAESIIRDLIAHSTSRLQMLCGAMLTRSYPRLRHPPLNLQPEELLGSVVARLMKALREIRPGTVRQFFALANQHMRWELNDLARRLDEQQPRQAMLEGQIVAAESSGSPLTVNARRILDAIDALPEVEREVFSLVRIQGMQQTEVAEMLEVSTKTVQRRLVSSLVKLSEMIKDLDPSLRREHVPVD